MKKFIAGVLSAVMCTSVVLSEADSFSTRKPESAAGQTASGQDDSLQGKNSFADYIARKASDPANRSGQQAVPLSQPAPQTQPQTFAVTYVDFNNQTGDIIAASTQSTDCKLLISFTNQDDPSDVYTVEAAVKAGESVITELKADLSRIPEFYIIKGQLLNRLGLPIGDSFLVSDNTRQVQEIRATDITAFDEEQVVNLDDRNDTNFLVLNEKTVQAESTDEVNTLVSADYDNNIYVFDNIDDTVRNLEDGSYFFAQPAPGDIVALTVHDVQIDGDKATISGEDAADEMFDFIKIETHNDNYEVAKDVPIPENMITSDNAAIQSENETEPAEEAVLDADASEAEPAEAAEDEESEMQTADRKYLGSNVAEADPLPDPYASGDLTSKLVFSLNSPFTDLRKTLTVTPSISYTIAFKINFYKSFGYLNFTLNTEHNFSFGLSATVKAPLCPNSTTALQNYLMEKTFEKRDDSFLPPITIPTGIPGVDFQILLGIDFFISGSFSMNRSIKVTTGYSYDSDRTGEKFQKQSATQSNENSFSLEGKFRIGLSISIEAELAKLIHLGVKFTIGFEATATIKATDKIEDGISTATTISFLCYDSSENTKHSCTVGLEGEVDFITEISLYLKIGFSNWKTLSYNTEGKIFEYRHKLLDWHACLGDDGKLHYGLGKCPKISYKTTFNLKDTFGDNPFDLAGHNATLTLDSHAYSFDDTSLETLSVSQMDTQLFFKQNNQ